MASSDTLNMASNNPIQGLSPKTETAIRRLSTVTVFILAAAAAVLSFQGLQTLAVKSGFDPMLAWLLPVIVDGMVLTGSLGVVAASLVGIKTWYPWTLTITGVIISVWGNVASAPDDYVSKAVHAIAPLTFALSVEGMLRIYRASAHATAQREAKVLIAEEKRLEREEKAAERAARLQHLTNGNLPASITVQTAPPVQGSAKPVNYANNGEPTARERITEYLIQHPEATGGEVARALTLDPSYTRKLIREIKPVLETKPAESIDKNPNLGAVISETSVQGSNFNGQLENNTEAPTISSI